MVSNRKFAQAIFLITLNYIENLNWKPDFQNSSKSYTIAPISMRKKSCLGFRIRVIIGIGIPGLVVIFFINDFSSTRKFLTVKNKSNFLNEKFETFKLIGKNEVGKFEPKLKL